MLNIITSPYCAQSRVFLGFLFCFIQDITKCKHFATTVKKIQSYTSMGIIVEMTYALFFLILLDETILLV